MSLCFGLFRPVFSAQGNIVDLEPSYEAIFAPTAGEAMKIAKKAGHFAPILEPLHPDDVRMFEMRVVNRKH